VKPKRTKQQAVLAYTRWSEAMAHEMFLRRVLRMVSKDEERKRRRLQRMYDGKSLDLPEDVHLFTARHGMSLQAFLTAGITGTFTS
jgi:hypothetical protein